MKLILIATLFLAALAAPAHADTFVQPVWPGAQNYFVGRDSVTGKPTALIREAATSHCNWTFLGGYDGLLTDTVRITMGNNGDSMEILTSQTTIWCKDGNGGWYTKTFTSVPSNSGYSMYVQGGSGNDYIDCNATWLAAVYCHGNGGNDFLGNSVATADIFLYGDDGTDWLRSTAYNANTRVHLDAGYGNLDCIDSSVAPAATYSCGIQVIGNTKRSTHVLGDYCTTIVSSCP